MSFEIEAPNSFDRGGAYLQEPGTYHFVVMNVDESPTAKDGTEIDGFRVDLEIPEGAGAQQRKQIELTFFNASKSADATDKGKEMSKKKQFFFAQATGIIPEAKPGEKVTVDLQQAKARQLIATVAKRKSQNSDKEFMDLNYADIWHVDDPSAAKCELSQAALKLLPKTLRRDPKSFPSASDAKAKSGNGSTGNGSTTAGGQSQAKAAAAAVDLDNL